MGKNYHTIFLMIGLLSIIIFSGCLSEDVSDQIVTEAFSGSFDSNQNTTLKVTNINGKIDINTYSGDTVKMDVEKRVREKEKAQFDFTKVNVTQDDNEIIIETIREDPEMDDVTVNLNILVPEYVNVESVTTSNGDVTVKGTEGYPTVSSSNGKVTVQGTDGISDVSTSNGEIIVEIHDFKEDIDISSSNGKIVVHLLSTLNATISMQTSNGDAEVIGLTLDDLVDGGKTLSGTLNGGGHTISISSSNANLELGKLGG
jgi:DUF4097 and DUF4098 domain-containing protein YvlB